MPADKVDFKLNLAKYDKDAKSQDWQSGLHMRGNSDELKVNSMTNAQLILTNDPIFADKLAFNSFTGDIVIKNADMTTPHFTLSLDSGKATSELIGRLRALMDDAYNVTFSADIATVATLYAAQQHKFNPLTDRLEKAKKVWIEAGKPNLIDTFFVDTLGATDSPATLLMTRLFFSGLVARAFEPGVKFDFMTILYSQEQGIGKTWLLAKLGGQYYTDGLLDMKSKDAAQIVAQKWLVNDDELAVTTDHRNNSFAVVKSFITRTADEFRPPYTAAVENFPRRFVLAGTTNERSILKDATGSRRSNIIACGLQPVTKPVAKLTEHDIDLVLGQATARYQSHDKAFMLTTTPEQQAIIDAAKQTFKANDDTTERVELILNSHYPANWWKQGRAEQRRYVGLMLDDSLDEQEDAPESLDRVSVPWLLDIGFNLDHTRSGTAQYRTMQAKVREIMDTREGWQPKRHIKFNQHVTSGYGRVTTS